MVRLVLNLRKQRVSIGSECERSCDQCPLASGIGFRDTDVGCSVLLTVMTRVLSFACLLVSKCGPRG